MRIKFKHIVVGALEKHREAVSLSSILYNKILLLVQMHAFSSIDIINQKIQHPC